MAAINFPSSPSVGNIHVVGDITWRWNGTSWVSNSTFNGRFPAGRTDQRPVDAKIGMIRYNSDIDAFEGYDAFGWRPFYGTIITTPVGISPAAAAVLAGGTTFTLSSDDDYFNVLGLSHASSDWQISSSPAFGTTVVNISADAANLTSYAVTGGISTAGTYYWRVRYRDSDGNESAYSTAIEFTVSAIITTPVGTSPTTGATVTGETTFSLVGNAYSNALGLSHASSDWQISTSPAFGTTVVNISADAVNLTSYAVTGGLSPPGTYYWRVRYRDSSGNVSAYSTAIAFTVSAPPPPSLGDSYCGGFYIGTICAASTCYYLIVAPNSSGCACCQWKTTRTATSGAMSCIDGRANTYGPLNNVTHPAGNWTATRTINGFSDWYLPSRDELAQLYTNASTLPVGQRFPNVPPQPCCPVPFYWTSTSCNTFASSGVWTQRFDCGSQFSGGLLKTNFMRVRAIRRHPV